MIISKSRISSQPKSRLIHANAEKWDVHPQKIGVAGTSAGGHVATTLGTHREDVAAAGDELDAFDYSPDFMILISALISFDDAVTNKGSKSILLGDHPDEELVKAYSNETRVTAQTPPAFIVQADNDNTVSPFNSIVFYEALKKAGVSSSLHIFPFGAHQISINDNPGSTEMWTSICMEWLKEMKVIEESKK